MNHEDTENTEKNETRLNRPFHNLPAVPASHLRGYASVPGIALVFLRVLRVSVVQLQFQTKARPVNRSSVRSGERSGCCMAEGGSRNVCSSRYWPPSAACSTWSVKQIQVDPGGKSMRS